MQKAILGSNLSNKCVKKIFFGEFYQINGIESSPNIGSIKLRTNVCYKCSTTKSYKVSPVLKINNKKHRNKKITKMAIVKKI